MSVDHHQNDDQLERLLRTKLKPQKVSWEADRTVLEAMLLKDEKAIRRKQYWGILRQSWIATLGLAAALAITFVYFTQFHEDGTSLESDPSALSPVQFASKNTTVATVPNLQYRAVEATNQLVGVQDNGWTDSDEDSVTRELKYEYIDTVDLVNEEDGSIMRMQIPREEIVNVTYQVI